MAYRKLGRDNKHRRSMLATMTKQVVENESITTTETRAKEVRKFVDKMITYGKKGDLVSRRKALAFLHNDKKTVEKIFNDCNASCRLFCQLILPFPLSKSKLIAPTFFKNLELSFSNPLLN